MFYVPSTYVLRLINISSTPHQHIFYVSSTSHQRPIYVTSTRDRRLIYEGSTSHLRGTLKRNESMFHLSPNQVLLAAFSCTKQVDGKPKQLAWACHLLAKSLPSPCHLLAISLRNPGLTFRQASVGTLFALRDVERPLRLSKSYLFTYYLLLSCLTTSETSVNIIINNIY